MVSGTKDPARVESGRRGALKRWSDPANRRTVKLTELQPAVRAAVLALVAADQAARAEAAATDPAPEAA